MMESWEIGDPEAHGSHGREAHSHAYPELPMTSRSQTKACGNSARTYYWAGGVYLMICFLVFCFWTVRPTFPHLATHPLRI